MLLLLCLVLSGCGCLGTFVRQGGPTAVSASSDVPAWWTVRFRFDWPEGREPAWHRDLLVAHVVVSPVITANRKDILLWRFHRRAARDAAGHQFSFLFYARASVASRIFDALRVSPTLRRIEGVGWVVSNSYDDLAGNTRVNVGDTSDAQWSEPVRNSWPYYIMGVSRMWLELIEEVAGPVPDGLTPVQLDERYRDAGARIDVIWAQEGGHAFLHHLNALFGYEPLILYENKQKREMRF